MVCVMLRLLEYHPGILFLTTNRVRSFDPAFESRVTVSLRYEPLAPDARAQVPPSGPGGPCVCVCVCVCVCARACEGGAGFYGGCRGRRWCGRR
jgi:hypothetical protein